MAPPAQRVPQVRKGLKVLKERRALLVLPVPQVLRVRLDRAIRAAAAVADATSVEDVVEQFNALLANLRAAGLLST